MKNKISTLLIYFFCSFIANAQHTSGSIAPNFTSTDIYGKQWDLYTLLNQGKTVVLEFMGTNCPGSWYYCTSHELDSLYIKNGPKTDSIVNQNSSEKIMVFMITTYTTDVEDLYGNTYNTLGDWVSNTSFPIIMDPTISNTKFQIDFSPTILMICPDKIIRNVGAKTAEEILNLSTENCFLPLQVNDASLRNTQYLTQSITACDSIFPTIRITNYGTDTLKDLNLRYLVDGVFQKNYLWKGLLPTNGFCDFNSVSLTSMPGEHNIIVACSSPNNLSDSITQNDTTDKMPFTIISENTDSLLENFNYGSYSSNNINILNYDNSYTSWHWEGYFTNNYQNTVCSYKLSFADDGSFNQKDAFVIKKCLKMRDTSLCYLKFDYAYSPWTFNYISNFLYDYAKDTLKVYLSTDCGENWKRVYMNAGLPMFTTNNYRYPFQPLSSEWRTDSIDLKPFNKNENLMFKFEGISTFGAKEGELWIDNIRASYRTIIVNDSSGINITTSTSVNHTDSIKSAAKTPVVAYSTINIFPNPANDLLNIISNKIISLIEVFDAYDKLVIKQNVNSNMIMVNIENLTGGIYFLKIVDEEKQTVKKFIKE